MTRVCLHVIHWNKLLSYRGQVLPHFGFLELCSLSTPKLW